MKAYLGGQQLAFRPQEPSWYQVAVQTAQAWSIARVVAPLSLQPAAISLLVPPQQTPCQHLHVHLPVMPRTCRFEVGASPQRCCGG